MTYKTAKKLVKKIINSGHSPLLLGDRGIGKTSLAFEVAKEMQKEVFYLNVSQTSPESLVFPVPEDSKVNLLTPSLDNKMVILDEITNRNPEIHSLLQSLVLDKRLGDTKYQNLTFIATGNRPEDSILAVDLPRPLVERFVLLDFPIPTKEEWAEYSIKNNGDLRFIQFMLQASYDLYYRKTEPEGLSQVPSPRNNTRTSQLINGIDDLDEIFILVSGSSGVDVATAFVKFLQEGRFYSYTMFKHGELPKNESEVLVLIFDMVNQYKEVEEVYKVFEFLDKSTEFRKFRHLFFTTIKENRGVNELEKILRSGHQGIRDFVKALKETISS